MPPKKAKAKSGSNGAKPRTPKSQTPNGMNVKDMLTQKFKELDTDGDGTLSFEELRVLLKQGDPKMKEETVRALYNAADLDKDGIVTAEEFIEFIFSSNDDYRTQHEEEEKEMNKVQSTTAWQRAATESSAHSRLGSVLGLYAHELSGGSGKMTWEEKHTLRLKGAEDGFGFELNMFERMGAKTNLNKSDTGVWEVAEKTAEVLLYPRTGHPSKRSLKVELESHRIVALQLKDASQPVSLLIVPED